MEQPLTLSTLEEARLRRDTFVILQGSQHEQIYLTCPAVLICCWEPVLRLLLRDLDALACQGEPLRTRVRYEQQPVGKILACGRGGGQIVAGLWIHQQLLEMGLERPIKGVLKGKLGRIPLRERLRCSLENNPLLDSIARAALTAGVRATPRNKTED